MKSSYAIHARYSLTSVIPQCLDFPPPADRQQKSVSNPDIGKENFL